MALRDMMERVRGWWQALLGSLWFVPALMVCASIGLAIGLVELEAVSAHLQLGHTWPRLFGAGAEGARGMLSAIATSMITVAGVIFSVTIVSLSLAASQYSPRVLRAFNADRPTQVVLGAFVSVFAYCLVVLRTIRSAEEGGFVPTLAVLGGVMMAMVGVALLIYFVHHVATAIQVPKILDRIAVETTRAIDRLYPSGLGTPGSPSQPPVLPRVSSVLAAPCTGYLVSVDGAALLDVAVAHALVVRIDAQVGDFVVDGQPMLWLHAPEPADEDALASLRRCLRIERERNITQDAAYGIQQMVDIALKALSPGIHDPTTAGACIDQISALMIRLATREFGSPFRFRGGTLRAIVARPTFGDILAVAFAAIAEHAGDHAEVHQRLLSSLSRLERATADASRRLDLALQAEALAATIARAPLAPIRSRVLLREVRTLRRRLASPVTSAAVEMRR